MQLTLSEMFERSETDTIEWRDQVVRAVIRFPVKDGARLRVRRLGSSRDRAQAIKLALNSGSLRVNGLSSPSMAIWSHTAPEEIEIEVTGRRASTLDVWNSWSLDGVDNAWLGNSGIIVQDHAGGHTLQCSDGTGDPDFSDLVVWLDIES